MLSVKCCLKYQWFSKLCSLQLNIFHCYLTNAVCIPEMVYTLHIFSPLEIHRQIVELSLNWTEDDPNGVGILNQFHRNLHQWCCITDNNTGQGRSSSLSVCPVWNLLPSHRAKHTDCCKMSVCNTIPGWDQTDVQDWTNNKFDWLYSTKKQLN